MKRFWNDSTTLFRLALMKETVCRWALIDTEPLELLEKWFWKLTDSG